MHTKINKIVCTKINKNTQTPSTHYVLHNKKKHEINKRNKNSEKHSKLFDYLRIFMLETGSDKIIC